MIDRNKGLATRYENSSWNPKAEGHCSPQRTNLEGVQTSLEVWMDHEAAEELAGLARGAGMELLGVQQAPLQRAGREQASGAATPGVQWEPGLGKGTEPSEEQAVWTGHRRGFTQEGCSEGPRMTVVLHEGFAWASFLHVKRSRDRLSPAEAVGLWTNLLQALGPWQDLTEVLPIT